MPISIAKLLKQQSPYRYFGNGCLELPNGTRWTPGQDQKALLSDLTSKPRKSLLQRFFV